MDADIPVGESELDADAHARNAARNQAMYREANERLCGYQRHRGSEMALVACECPAVACAQPVRLSLAEYEHIRRFPTRFIVRPDHAQITGERVVEKTADYVVVEKVGAGALVAIRLDPRRASNVRHRIGVPANQGEDDRRAATQAAVG